MNRRGTILLALAALGAALGAPASRAADIDFRLAGVSIDIGLGPPPLRVEPVPPLRYGHVWAPGYWRWEGRCHEWVPGRWLAARRDYAWMPDRWTPAGHRWHYEPGHWEREPGRQRHRDHRGEEAGEDYDD